ncbi:hypothetical protein PUN28_000610 [Cardiocondyla obscurior]|uniref:Uncharacterized protein n=1 Tax=Cardiocondyla obscurior TaxID=286306 RepID=A0AAW2H0R2_9HYME
MPGSCVGWREFSTQTRVSRTKDLLEIAEKKWNSPVFSLRTHARALSLARTRMCTHMHAFPTTFWAYL